jgi:prepilin-type N-terminal cleavage/methylation domain-containing protein
MVYNNKGLTLIELLAGLAIVSIMMVGVYLTYISFSKTALDTRQIAKTESEVNQALFKLEKLIQSTGFGIDKLNINNAFKVDNSSITFKTLFGDKIESGLWEVCVDGKRYITKDYPVVVLNEEKKKKGSINAGGINCGKGSIMYVCKDNSSGECDDPYYFEKELRLSANTSKNYDWSKHCAPGTHNLLLGNSPYLGCIADFQVDYNKDDKKLKLGIIYQNGNRKDSALSKTFNYDSLPKSYTLTSEQEYYRWEKSEIVLDLINLN